MGSQAFRLATQPISAEARLKGKSAYECVQGRPYHGELLVFGQPVMARLATALEIPKLAER